jgi:hypothetical protein
MPAFDDRTAESLICLVAPADRAAAAIGDLLEEHGDHWSPAFWRAVLRTAGAFVWRDLTTTPLAMIATAAVGWLGFMAIALLWSALVQFAAVILWGAVYVISHHTALELVLDALRLQFAWAPPLPALTQNAELLALLVIAPTHLGRYIAN